MREGGYNPDEARAAQADQYNLTRFVDQFRAESTYERTALPDGRLELSREGEKYHIKRIEDPKDPAIPEIHRMLRRKLGSEEVDSVSVTREALDDNLHNPDRRADLLLQTIRNEKGNIIGVVSGSLGQARSEAGEALDWDVAAVNYLELSSSQEGKGLMPELYAAFGELLADRSGQSGRPIKLIVAENAPQERELNVQVEREPYARTPGGEMQALPYWQPPLEFDAKTGEPAEGAGAVPEHLMVISTDGKTTVPSADVLAAVRMMYEYFSVDNDPPVLKGNEGFWQRELIGEDPETKILRQNQELYNRLKGAIGVAETVELVTLDERRLRSASGERFIEHEAALARAREEAEE